MIVSVEIILNKHSKTNDYRAGMKWTKATLISIDFVNTEISLIFDNIKNYAFHLFLF